MCGASQLSKAMPHSTSASTVSHQSTTESQYQTTLYSDVTAGRYSGIGGYTSTTNSSISPVPTHSNTRPPRTHRPPTRYDDFVCH